jgi:hypothetical protein
MSVLTRKTVFTLLLALAAGGLILTTKYLATPLHVLEVDFPFPTRDKSQSKIWHAEQHWWALLPDDSGSSLWKRNANGEWSLQQSRDAILSEISGLADVWARGPLIGVASYTAEELSFALLSYDQDSGQYSSRTPIKKWRFPQPRKYDPAQQTACPVPYAAATWWTRNTITNVTVARDDDGIWWLSFIWDRTPWVIASLGAEAREWTDPIAIGAPVAGYARSIVFPVPGGIGVMWGEQNGCPTERVLYAFHANGEAASNWVAPLAIEEGTEVAEDHFNAARSSDGTVYVVTSSDPQQPGDMLLQLRVLVPHQAWESTPFALLTDTSKPTRAVVAIGGQNETMFIAHNRLLQGKRVRGEVVYRCVQRSPLHVDSTEHSLIAHQDLDVRDPTAAKAVMPDAVDWIILASDGAGRVYEGIPGACNRER